MIRAQIIAWKSSTGSGLLKISLPERNWTPKICTEPATFFMA